MIAPDSLAQNALRLVRSSCATCWQATHPSPPAYALVLLDDYKWELGQARYQEQYAYRLAQEAGQPGDLNEVQYAAHREAFAAGDDDELEAMLRHVRLDD